MDLSPRFIGLGAVALSPFVGSFICCLIDRIPNGVNVVWSRSKCDKCRGVLSPLELVPIFSYVALRGKCRKCKAQIPLRLIGAEIGIAALTGGAVWFSEPQQIFWAISFAWLLFSLAQYDVVHGRLPDALTASLCMLGLMWSIACRVPVSVTASLVGALSGVTIAYLLAKSYRRMSHRDGLGGGDIKLFGASGAWIGWQALPTLLLVASSSAILVLVVNGRLSRLERISFGPFIVFATFLIWCWQISR